MLPLMAQLCLQPIHPLHSTFLPSFSSNYSLAIETYQTDFKPGHEIENNFNKPPN